jgi:hypothetical protein
MKTLHRAERCQVLLEPDAGGGIRLVALRFRGAKWLVRSTLEVFVYWGEWWCSPSLVGEHRCYHVLGTSHGEITLMQRLAEDPSLSGWFVVGWFD